MTNETEGVVSPASAPMKQPILVLYHGNCADGFGAALAAFCLYGDSAEYREVHYGQPAPTDIEGRDVLIVDFSYPRAVLDEMRARAQTLAIIDHHKTAAEDLAGYPKAVFDMTRSGAVMTWEALHEGRDVPVLLRYVQDRDLWQWKLPNSRAVSLALWAIPKTFEAWSQHLHDIGKLAADGGAMIVYQNFIVEQQVAQARTATIRGHSVPVANASTCFSEVGDALCKAFPNAPFSAYYFDRGDGMQQWGLRSRNGFDTSAIAKSFGGGGHAAASGFSVPRRDDFAWLAPEVR